MLELGLDPVSMNRFGAPAPIPVPSAFQIQVCLPLMRRKFYTRYVQCCREVMQLCKSLQMTFSHNLSDSLAPPSQKEAREEERRRIEKAREHQKRAEEARRKMSQRSSLTNIFSSVRNLFSEGSRRESLSNETVLRDDLKS